MKKLTFLLLLSIFYSGNSEAQDTPKLEVGIFNNASLNAPNLYCGMGAFVGPQIDLRTGSISIYAMYQFYTNSTGSGLFSLQSHLLGGGFQYRILSREKRFSPYIELTAMTEVGTNYRDGYLNVDGMYPMDQPSSFSYTKPETTFYYASFYHSTPLVGSAIVGCDIRLTENLHLSVGAGYGLRFIKSSYAWWNEKVELTKETLNDYSIPLRDWHDMIDVKLGISYAFSLKKKENKRFDL